MGSSTASDEPTLPIGITYGGRGPGGEFYSKDLSEFHSCSLWTKGDESWTSDELRLIAKHQDYLSETLAMKERHEQHCSKFETEVYGNGKCTGCGIDLSKIAGPSRKGDDLSPQREKA